MRYHVCPWGGTVQFVSCLPLNLRTQVWSLMWAWIESPYAWMRGEKITSCKSHIASVSLTNWCIMIKKKKSFVLMKSVLQLYQNLIWSYSCTGGELIAQYNVNGILVNRSILSSLSWTFSQNFYYLTLVVWQQYQLKVELCETMEKNIK